MVESEYGKGSYLIWGDCADFFIDYATDPSTTVSWVTAILWGEDLLLLAYCPLDRIGISYPNSKDANKLF